MEPYTTKHKDGTTVTYTGKNTVMSEILAIAVKELTHTHNFIFLFGNGYKAEFPIHCYVDVIEKDITDCSQKNIVKLISARVLKTALGVDRHKDCDAVWVFDALMNSNCFLYTHEFTDPAKMFRFYFVQSEEIGKILAFNRDNLVLVSIEGYI